MPKSAISSALHNKIADHSARVGVVGMGYVGLPFAVEKAKVGFAVLGIDRNSNRVAQLMIIGWAFSFMIEGASGFGTPVALAAAVALPFVVPKT